MVSKKKAPKKFFRFHSLAFWTFLIVVLTPWFWFLSPPKNWLKTDFKNDIKEARLEVIWERGEVGNSFISKLFSNWPVVFIRRRLAIVMENLDIGNYFFSGHPRARMGVEEKQKFFFFQFLLLMIGLMSPRLKKYGKFLTLYFLAILLADFIFKWRGYNETILFSIPFLILISLGMEQVFKWPKKILTLFTSLSFAEIATFLIFFSNGLLK